MSAGTWSKSPAAVATFLRETGGWVAAHLEACTRCAICADACHFYQAVGNPEYMPIWKVEPLRRAYEQRFTPEGRVKRLLGLEKRLSDQDLEHWSRIVYEACTVCNKCAWVCPMGIQIGPLIHRTRAGMVAAGLVPADLAAATAKQVEAGSPLGVTDAAWRERIEWIADEWDAKIPMDVKGADTMALFTSLEVMKFPATVAAVAKIMAAAGQSWTVSSKGREAVNFGYFEADDELTKTFLARVFDAARDLGVRRIMVDECGHAFEALRWAAPDMIPVPPGIEVTHIVKVAHDLWKGGRIKLKEGAHDGTPLSFHDACKIQRRGGFIREPRELLKVLAPRAFREIVPNREGAICCGGGGGVVTIAEADPQRYAVFGIKLRQLTTAGAEAVCMVCSNCRLTFTEGVAHFASPVKVLSLTEMVAQALA